VPYCWIRGKQKKNETGRASTFFRLMSVPGMSDAVMLPSENPCCWQHKIYNGMMLKCCSALLMTTTNETMLPKSSRLLASHGSNNDYSTRSPNNNNPVACTSKYAARKRCLLSILPQLGHPSLDFVFVCGLALCRQRFKCQFLVADRGS
jgi:hypothetical protein